MKAQFKVGQNLQLEVDVANQKELFAEMAKHQEVFNNTECGHCKSSKTRFVVRHVVVGKKTYDYYEMHCEKCRCRLAFGVHNSEDGTLFPKRKDETGAYLPDNGWTQFKKETEEEKKD